MQVPEMSVVQILVGTGDSVVNFGRTIQGEMWMVIAADPELVNVMALAVMMVVVYLMEMGVGKIGQVA